MYKRQVLRRLAAFAQVADVVEQREEDAHRGALGAQRLRRAGMGALIACLLYTSDAADERSSGDLGGRRIIKKKKTEYHSRE